MSTCQACTAPSPDAFLCTRCQGDLRAMLCALPEWLDRLAEAAVGQVRMGDIGRGNNRPGLRGDDEVLPKCTCGHPEHELSDECGEVTHTTVTVVLDQPDDDGNMTREEPGPDQICNCREYAPSVKQAKMRDQFLATGRVNARASRLLDKAQNTLTTIVRGLIESRGVELPPSFGRAPQIGVAACHRMAQWLSGQIGAISAGEDAGQTYADIKRLVGDSERDGDIARVIDRPIRRIWLGDCPTWNEHTRQVCGTSLWAPEDAIETVCPRCRRTHNCNRLRLLQFSDLEREKVPWDRILRANKSQPADRQIPERTLQSWRKPGKNGEPPKLKIRGYLRPDGHTGINRHSEDDEELYLWPDVRKLRQEKPQKGPTGAAAHRKVKAG